MNKKVLTMLGCILAAASVSAKEVVVAPSHATEVSLESRLAALEAQLNNKADKSALEGMTKDFEFHGYARSGFLTNARKGLKKAEVPFLSQNLYGRLGNEDSNYGEAELVKTWRMDNGSWAKYHVMFYTGDATYTVKDSNDIGLAQSFVEMGNLPTFTGAFKDSVIWAGKRYYNRRDIHITDFYYTNFSGTGAGIEKIKLGAGALDLAVIGTSASDEENKIKFSSNMDIMNITAIYRVGNWEFDLLANKSQDNEDRYKVYGTTEKAATDGFYGMVQYNAGDFYGLTKGFSKYFVQAGTGLASAGSLGQTAYGAGNAEDSSSLRVGSWALANINSNWDLFTAVYAQFDNDPSYNKDEASMKDSYDVYSVVARPIYIVNENFEIQTEFGYSFQKEKFANGNKNDMNNFKATFAPTFKLDANQFWARPEIRTFVSYVRSETEKNNSRGTKTENNINVGVQGEVWF